MCTFHNPPNLMVEVVRHSCQTYLMLPFLIPLSIKLCPENFVHTLPFELYENSWIRRCSFHGTSHYYVTHRAAFTGKPVKPTKIITLHLSNGASVTPWMAGLLIPRWALHHWRVWSWALAAGTSSTIVFFVANLTWDPLKLIIT